MKKQRPVIIFSLLIVLVLALTATSVYFYRKYNRATGDVTTSQKEIDALVRAVGKITMLPEGETPTIATVSDPEKLKGQAFFADAKAGDKVLIYTTAKKAILYDPVARKIVNIAPIDSGGNVTPAATPVPAKKQ